MIPIRDHNPSRRTPVVTYALIAINVVVFLGYAALLFEPDGARLQAFFEAWALQPGEVTRGEGLHGLFTCMFLHGSLLHIGGNMLFLWIFGDNIEDFFGSVGYLLFYLVSGLAASALQIAADPASMVPNVGASGAIAGVMGAYLLLYPRALVDVLVPLGVFTRVVAMPALAVLAIWFVLQIVGGFGSIGQQGGGVAYWAHAGGFVAGLALAALLWLAGRSPNRIDGHPNHPEAVYRAPIVRRRGPWG